MSKSHDISSKLTLGSIAYFVSKLSSIDFANIIRQLYLVTKRMKLQNVWYNAYDTRDKSLYHLHYIFASHVRNEHEAKQNWITNTCHGLCLFVVRSRFTTMVCRAFIDETEKPAERLSELRVPLRAVERFMEKTAASRPVYERRRRLRRPADGRESSLSAFTGRTEQPFTADSCVAACWKKSITRVSVQSLLGSFKGPCSTSSLTSFP